MAGITSELYKAMNKTSNSARCWVAFTGQTEIGFLKGLKKGFRHCFAIIHDGERWLSIDPLSNHMEVLVHNVPGDFDLPKWLADRGYKMVEARIDRTKRSIAPVLPFTCVEAIKRFLGIHAWHILTPFQLYKHLEAAQMNPRSLPSSLKKTQERISDYGSISFST
jgi:hypothetical protein